MHQIISSAEPFFLPGEQNRPGCLLIHGFTGTPKEMRWMGEYITSNGYTTLGIRLSGHATNPLDMLRSRHTDWLASVEDGYAMLRGWTNQIVLVGLSLGGVLALLSSTRLDVMGVIAISTPYALPRDPRLRFIKQISVVKPFMEKSKDPPGSGWFDQEAWRDHVSYPENPVIGIGELNTILAELRLSLPRVRAPVLLIHSRDDSYVLPESSQKIYTEIGSPDKELLYVSRSGHVVTRDAARQEVFAHSLRFISRLERTS